MEKVRVNRIDRTHRSYFVHAAMAMRNGLVPRMPQKFATKRAASTSNSHEVLRFDAVRQ